jgi:hypothetical protein
MKEYFTLLESAGYSSALKGMRLPTKSKNDSIFLNNNEISLGLADAKLASNLIKKGPVHGKFQRGITAWFDINMPRYIWSELDTYSIGVAPTSSESTMYTLKKETSVITDDDIEIQNSAVLAKELIGDVNNFKETHFIDHTPIYMVQAYIDCIIDLEKQYGSIKNIPIEIIKSCLPEGWMQRRIKSFSYQVLRSIYYYRTKHRLPEWQTISSSIKTVKFFEELLLGMPVQDFKFDGDK